MNIFKKASFDAQKIPLVMMMKWPLTGRSNHGHNNELQHKLRESTYARSLAGTYWSRGDDHCQWSKMEKYLTKIFVTIPGWNWGKRRLHQPTFTQWSGKGLKNYCRFNLLRKHKAATKSFWKRVWVQFPIYQVLAGALESHWNALKDDEVYKREINADPTIFRMRSSSAYCSCRQCLLHCIICFVLPLIVIANAIIIISVIIIVTLISVIIIKLQSGGLK